MSKLGQRDSDPLTGLASITVCDTDKRRCVVQQLKFKVLSRYYTFYVVFPYICRFIFCVTLLLTISKTYLYLGDPLTGECILKTLRHSYPVVP
jgi:hypothetical protein